MIQFLTITNAGYAVLAKNLTANFGRPHLCRFPLTVQCLDDEAVRLLAPSAPQNVRVLRSTLHSVEPFCTFNTPQFNRLVRCKLQEIQNALGQGTDTWYVDSDVAFLRDPTPYLDSGLDVQAQADAKDFRLCYSVNLCTGNMALRSNSVALGLLEQVICVTGTTIKNDQHCFNRVVFGGGSDCRLYPGVRIGLLPPHHFPNGRWLFKKVPRAELPRLPLDPVAVHANYITGKNAKIAALRRAGAWYL